MLSTKEIVILQLLNENVSDLKKEFGSSEKSLRWIISILERRELIIKINNEYKITKLGIKIFKEICSNLEKESLSMRELTILFLLLKEDRYAIDFKMISLIQNQFIMEKLIEKGLIVKYYEGQKCKYSITKLGQKALK